MSSQAGMSWTPYIQAGKAAGFRINFHGDELNPLGGAEMGASIQAEAISHLEEVRILMLREAIVQKIPEFYEKIS